VLCGAAGGGDAANSHDPFHRLSNDHLIAAERAMRMKAWHASKSLPGAYNDAHARFGDAWCQLHREVKRRGLSPSTDDPSFRSPPAHADEK
jgi:hypothetical protein